MGGNADLIRALLPSPETDLAGLFRDGRISRVEFYANREALFEATGLRISGPPGARQQ